MNAEAPVSRPRSLAMIGRALPVAVLLLLGVTSGWLDHNDLEATWRFFAGISGVLLAVLLVRVQARKFIERRRVNPGPTADPMYRPEPSWLHARREEAAKAAQELTDLTSAPIEMFIEMVIKPREYRDRTVETVSLQGHLIKQCVSVEYSLGPGSARLPMAYVPILLPPKGELLDDFRVYSADNKSLSDLSYPRTMELISLALRLLVMKARSDVHLADSTSRGDELCRKIRDTEMELLSIIARRGRIPDQVAKDDITRAFGPLESGPDVAGIHQLKNFVSNLATAYPIVVVTPVEPISGRILIKYERMIISAPELLGIADWARVMLGLRPYKVRLPLNLAETSRSYHLLVEGPGDQYLMEQSLWSQSTQTLLKPSHGPDRYFRLRSKRGQNYAHVYMRDFHDAPEGDVELLALFGETLPGTLGVSVVTAGAVAALVWVAGQIVSHGKTPPDIAALVLAFPAIAVSWFGFVSDRESILKCSVAARLSLIVSGVISFCAAGLYLFQLSHRFPPVRWTFGLLGITNPWWAVILCLAAANLGNVAARFAIRWTYFHSLFAKS